MMESILYAVTFESGERMEEYGSSVADVQGFIDRCYKHKGKVVSIVNIPFDF